MHPDEQALLQSVIENPDDDVPRLVIADWYEENGQPERAEFIRVQIALNGSPISESERIQLREQETDLLSQYFRDWSQPLFELFPIWEKDAIDRFRTKSPRLTHRFRRGFIDQVRFSEIETFFNRQEEFFQTLPVRDLIFEDDAFGYNINPSAYDPLELVRLGKCPKLNRIRRLEVGGIFTLDRELIELLTSPYLNQLDSLSLRWPVGEIYDLWNFFPKLSCSETLRTLELGKDIALGELDGLCQSFDLPNLEVLSLSGMLVTPEKAFFLMGNPFINRLRELKLYYSNSQRNDWGLSDETARRLRKHFGDRLTWI